LWFFEELGAINKAYQFDNLALLRQTLRKKKPFIFFDLRAINKIKAYQFDNLALLKQTLGKKKPWTNY
jgi:uncharacterized protein YkuJ